MRTTHVFFNGRVLTNAIVGVAIGSTSPFGAGVLALDAEPALDVYLRRNGACVEALEKLGGHAPKGVLAFDCIARTKGTGGFHNQTLVVLAVS
ncbi:MAG TPA: hypothetical protein VFG00_04975 [Acidothermaceae bacterium]|nr:hypothetical protein [Acidothermaceae bacterium]